MITFNLKKKTATAAVIIIVAILSGCLHRREPLKHERGIVVEKQYKPEFDATGNSFNSDGRIGFQNLHDHEKFIVVFKCEHGVVFSINKNSIYAKLNKGDTVTIDYYEMVNRYGLIEEWDFIDANVKVSHY